MQQSKSKGIVVAGTHSGSGKTTLTLGLIAALVNRGYRVAPFKVGPDFIDPGHLTKAAGVTGRNLDGWMLTRDYNSACFHRHSRPADMAVVEGVMGLFDGFDGRSEAGSTAQIAKWLGLPVLLIIDAKSMARSAAAVAQGFENFDPHLTFAGIVFNNVGSPGHLEYLQQALADHVKTPLMGGILRDNAITIPERHLGLYTHQDHPLSDDGFRHLARLVEDSLDLDEIINAMSITDFHTRTDATKDQSPKPTRPVRIAVAMDRAFCFYYQDNLDLLARKGAELIYFSPLVDSELPPDVSGLYLGGGYPELYAKELSANTAMIKSIRHLSRNGLPVYGECGGFMYLGEHIDDLEGNRFEMTACLPVTFRMLTRLKALGYREVIYERSCLIGSPGQAARGHEFHYSELKEKPQTLQTTYRVSARGGKLRFTEGYQVKNTLGSYIHLHFGSAPEVAATFVNSCLEYRSHLQQTESKDMNRI